MKTIWKSDRSWLHVLSLVVACSACSPAPQPKKDPEHPGRFQVEDEAALKDIRRALLKPSELPHVVWRQRLRITARGQTHDLEAVLQNDGLEFQVLGLGPGGMKLFLITQDAHRVRAESFVPRPLTLSPEYLLFDIQRALFWAPPSPCADRLSWNFKGFSVSDVCKNGAVSVRVVGDGTTGSNQTRTSLSIRYEVPFDFQKPPTRVTLRHEYRDYQIAMTQLESHDLP